MSLEKILLVVVIAIPIIIGVVILMYKDRINRVRDMSYYDMIKFIIQNDESIKISIATISNGEIDYKVYGKNGEEEYKAYDYEIGSVSKTFVALLISKAIYEGKIDIKDSIDKYLDLDEGRYYPTIERLITHTSGYRSYYFDKQMIRNKLTGENDYSRISKEKILNKVREIDLEDRDYNFVYSNFGISVLGLVLEKVYDENFTTLMNKYIKEQLDLNNTVVAKQSGNLDKYWEWNNNDGYIPAGAIISNIEDMSKYLKIYLDTNEEYILNTYKKLKDINANRYLYEEMGIRLDEIGMTWIRDSQNNIIWHNGGTSNYNSYIGFNKEKNVGVVVLGNVSPFKKIPMTFIGIRILNELSK